MLDSLEIQKYLPHRFPFLLIDRVLEVESGKRIVGLKNVTFNEPFFQGHFPGNPVMPGVLIIEAMAQVGGILAFYSGVQGDTIYFMSIEKAKFRKPVVPGDQLRLEINVLKRRNNVWKFSGEAFVGDKVVSEVDFTAMVSGSKNRQEYPTHVSCSY
jgi:3-hydroxyacyl-[acyl-carrier-protein] dehydratase